MELVKTNISGVVLLKPRLFGDERGYFFESYNHKVLSDLLGIDVNFVQDNESKSCYGVLRGLHFQNPPYSQRKLVRVVKGEVMDVAVDIRKGSPTYGKYYSAILSEQNHYQLFMTKGIAHGFAVLSDEAIFQYKCDELYHPEAEGAIAWNDPDLNIDWKIPFDKIILSAKDQKHPQLSDFDNKFVFSSEKIY